MNKNILIREIEESYKYKNILRDIVKNEKYKQIIIIGNGGSNSIASHISQDYTKQLGKKAFSFSDPSRLTCYINDYGRDEAYKVFVKEFADRKDTLVILISSSGKSENIVNAAKMCEEMEVDWISLTGFSINNTLHTLSCNHRLLRQYVNSTDYGIVECVHQIFLHSILGE